ncbi:hypothetical protein JHW43_003536 [Diplocarpon mali]|nr:hypothetical protein JHW43_003536 [Diplocarpon mali]
MTTKYSPPPCYSTTITIQPDGGGQAALEHLQELVSACKLFIACSLSKSGLAKGKQSPELPAPYTLDQQLGLVRGPTSGPRARGKESGERVEGWTRQAAGSVGARMCQSPSQVDLVALAGRNRKHPPPSLAYDHDHGNENENENDDKHRPPGLQMPRPPPPCWTPCFVRARRPLPWAPVGRARLGSPALHQAAAKCARRGIAPRLLAARDSDRSLRPHTSTGPSGGHPSPQSFGSHRSPDEHAELAGLDRRASSLASPRQQSRSAPLPAPPCSAGNQTGGWASLATKRGQASVVRGSEVQGGSPSKKGGSLEVEELQPSPLDALLGDFCVGRRPPGQAPSPKSRSPVASGEKQTPARPAGAAFRTRHLEGPGRVATQLQDGSWLGGDGVMRDPELDGGPRLCSLYGALSAVVRQSSENIADEAEPPAGDPMLPPRSWRGGGRRGQDRCRGIPGRRRGGLSPSPSPHLCPHKSVSESVSATQPVRVSRSGEGESKNPRRTSRPPAHHSPPATCPAPRRRRENRAPGPFPARSVLELPSGAARELARRSSSPSIWREQVWPSASRRSAPSRRGMTRPSRPEKRRRGGGFSLRSGAAEQRRIPWHVTARRWSPPWEKKRGERLCRMPGAEIESCDAALGARKEYGCLEREASPPKPKIDSRRPNRKASVLVYGREGGKPVL